MERGPVTVKTHEAFVELTKMWADNPSTFSQVTLAVDGIFPEQLRQELAENLQTFCKKKRLETNIDWDHLAVMVGHYLFAAKCPHYMAYMGTRKLFIGYRFHIPFIGNGKPVINGNYKIDLFEQI